MATSDDDPEVEDIEDDVDEGYDDVDDGDEGIRPVTRSRWTERILSTGRSANRTVRTPTTKAAIERLDPRERRFSFAAGSAAVLFGIVIYLLETQDKVHFTKNPDAPVTTLVLGLASGLLLLGATFIGRRAPVGFVALFAFLIFGTSSIILGAPFLVLAVWLLYRSYRIQREATARVRAGRSTGVTTKSSTTRAAGASASSSGRSPKPTASARKEAKRGPVMPEANKRYTPKRPPPPAPKPSRRERKAARTSD
jgi:hypothetical protein